MRGTCAHAQAPSGSINQAQADRQKMLESVRTSDAATTSKALQDFDITQLNPNKDSPTAAAAQGPASAAAASAPVAAPAVPAAPAAPQKIAIMNDDGTHTIQTFSARPACCLTPAAGIVPFL